MICESLVGCCNLNNSCESLGCNKMILYTYHQVILPYCTLDGRRHIICCSIINHHIITIISTANNNKTLHAVQMAFGSRIGSASPKSGPTCFFVVFTGNASRKNVPNKRLISGTFLCAVLGTLRSRFCVPDTVLDVPDII